MEDLIDFDPHALTQITASATGLAPPIPVLLAFFPLPIIGHDAELQRRLVKLDRNERRRAGTHHTKA